MLVVRIRQATREREKTGAETIVGNRSQTYCSARRSPRLGARAPSTPSPPRNTSLTDDSRRVSQTPSYLDSGSPSAHAETEGETDDTAASSRLRPLVAEWRNRASLLPIVGPVATVLLVAYGQKTVASADRAYTSTVLEPLRREIARTQFQPKNAALATADLEARFAWEPMFLLFVLVAVGVMLYCVRMLWEAYREHHAQSPRAPTMPARLARRPVTFGLCLGLATLVVGIAFARSGIAAELMRDAILDPVLLEAFPKQEHARWMVDWVLWIFGILTFVAAAMVTAAGAAALWTPPFADAKLAARPTLLSEHLAEQWRGLHRTLHAGALLLVAAVLQQATLYGWAPALTRGAADAIREVKAERVAHAAGIAGRFQQARGSLAADSILLRARLPGAASAASLDTAVAAGALRVTAAAAASARANAQLSRDTVLLNRRIAVLEGLAERMDRATAATMQRSIGLVYTLLLAVLYVPAALLLMRRARALAAAESAAAGDDSQAARDAWRARHGLAFSLTNHWGKALTVLSPWLTAGPAAFLSQYLSG